MDFRIRLQLAEAFGPQNRWFCSENYGREIHDKELLLMYYIRSGGAADFARRYEQALGVLNRWYCSEFYGRDIRDPETLWEYYIHLAPARADGRVPRHAARDFRFELSLAC
jgi:hypothetical protein